jgi:hypothetical protein
VVALLVGLCVSFAHYVLWTRVTFKYEPGLSLTEMNQLSQLPIAQAEAVLAGRRKPLGRTEWLASAIGQSNFWTDVAKGSVLPAIGIFFSCVFVGALTRRDTSRNPQRQSVE